MNSYTHSELRNQCSTLLRPLLSMLVVQGVNWQDFSRVAREQYVSIAREELSSPGQLSTDSVVAAVTGLSPEEFPTDAFADEFVCPGVSTVTVDASSALSGWHHDDAFRNGYGGPLPLPMEGPVPSFRALFDRYCKGKCRQSVIDSLVDAGSVERNAEGRLVARRRFYIPPATETAHMEQCSANLAEHARTVGKNLAGRSEQRFEGLAICDRAAPDAVEAFHKFIATRAQRFLEEVDDWLDEYSLHPDDLSTTPRKLGLGVYTIEGNTEKGTML